MKTLTKFDPADPSESEVYAFDFAPTLQSGETIDTTSWAIEPVAGEDDAASTRLDGLAQVLGLKSVQRLSYLKSGVTYKVTATIVTTLNNHISLWTFIQCV